MALSELYNPYWGISKLLIKRAYEILHCLAFKYPHSITPHKKEVYIEVRYNDSEILKIYLHGYTTDYAYWHVVGDGWKVHIDKIKPFDINFIKALIDDPLNNSNQQRVFYVKQKEVKNGNN